MLEEDGRPLALHSDIEQQAVVLGAGEQRLAVGGRQRGQHLVRGVVAEVDPRALVAKQAAREDVRLEVHRAARYAEREAAVGIRPAAPPAPTGGIPQLDDAVRDRLALPVEQPPAQLDSLLVQLVLRPPAEADREERADGLRRCPHSNGVRRSTMSQRKQSAHSGSVVARSKRATSSSRARGSRTALKIGSYGWSGSPGKYICVTRRWANARPKTEKWMCAGRHAFAWLRHGYEPGLTVTKR